MRCGSYQVSRIVKRFKTGLHELCHLQAVRGKVSSSKVPLEEDTSCKHWDSNYWCTSERIALIF